MLKPLVTTAALLSLFLADKAEGANPAPNQPVVSTHFIWLGDGIQFIDHLRQPGEVAASFKVQPKQVPDGTELVFELIALGDGEPTVRWRCVAESNIEECFTAPVVVGFRAKDQAIRLQVQLVDPSGEFEGPFDLGLGR